MSMPTIEVVARIVSNPAVRIASETNIAQLSAQIFTPIIAALLTYWLTTWHFQKGERKKEEGLKKILENEIYHNVFMMADLHRKVKWIDDNPDAESPDFSSIYKFLEYNEPIYWAFESAVKSGAVESIKDNISDTFLLYNLIRDYDRLLKREIDEINSIPSIKGDRGLKAQIEYEKLHIIDLLAQEISEIFEKQYINKIMYLSSQRWQDFKNKMAIIMENKLIW